MTGPWNSFLTSSSLAVRSAPAIVGYGTALAVVLGAFSYTGGKLTGYERDPTVDEVSRKEYLRTNRRRSIEQTINELGEGRGESSSNLWHHATRPTTSEMSLVPFADCMSVLQVFLRQAMRSGERSASKRPTVSMCRSRDLL